MKIFAMRGRRLTVADPGVGAPEPSVERSGLPHRFEAVEDALTSGSDVRGACAVAGQELARDGASVEEAMHGLQETWLATVGTDPPFDVLVSMLSAWSDTTLGYLHQLSCEDPLTGLSSQAHLRGRLGELYRLGDLGHASALGGPAGGVGSHALVVLAMPSGDDPSEEPVDHFTRAMRLARVGELARTPFAGDETVARLGMHRIAILTRRDDRLGRRVRLLRTLLDSAEPTGTVRVWIEGLPTTSAGAGMLLDELARA